ncbi:methyl-accepting chemotaxis protein [Salibacterium salarium]|uniref:Methyl-accepting chemotaxis protein n=1 Tax=Salibacterium salarium TaxID=284579 RepID=A0A3R9P4K2_9BACI|nr:methyl-accepting chemotaxis protein [Salibacterium salarium]RSL30211.1 methyl-accepting chemotaxis protein [Salibacterium salarium]
MQSIRAKLIGAFSIILALLLIFTGVLYFLIKDMNREIETVVEEDMETIAAYEDLAYNIAERQSLANAYTLTGNNQYKEEFQTYTEESVEMQENLLSYVDDERLNELVDRSIDWRTQIEEDVFAQYDEGNRINAEDALRSEISPLGTEIKNDLDSLIKEENTAINTHTAQVNNQGDNLVIICIVAGIGITIMGLIIAIVLSNRMSSPIKLVSEKAKQLSNGDLTVENINVKSKDEVGQLAVNFNDMADNLRDLLGKTRTAAERVAATSEQLSASSQETSASTNEIATTIQDVSNSTESTRERSKESLSLMKELSINIKKVTEASAEAAEKAKETEKAAEDGNKEITHSSEQMGIIDTQVQDSAEIVKQLGERSSEIGTIIETITSISEQTNLLALNAAIEAARAGEHGKGFAVVADEVRKLAEESNQSANKITQLIEGIQQETDRAVEKMSQGQTEAKEGVAVIERAGTAFQTILTSIQEVGSQVQNVSDISKQMSANSSQVTTAVEEMSQVAETNAGSAQNVAAGTEEQLSAMEEISSSSEELSSMAQDLQEEVSKFKLS